MVPSAPGSRRWIQAIAAPKWQSSSRIRAGDSVAGPHRALPVSFGTEVREQFSCVASFRLVTF